MSQFITDIYNKVALISPHVEVRMRQLYWYNMNLFRRFNPNRNKPMAGKGSHLTVEFKDILQQIEEWGVHKGALLIVHSSYDNLESLGLPPLEIIKGLKELVGDEGTLVMPVIRHYKEEPDAVAKMKRNYMPPKALYNPRRTPVISGILPMILMRMPGAKISQHPLNPICAIGPLAEEIIRDNISGEKPSPHGPDSSWYHCYLHDAAVVGLGTDLRHHNTIGHVAEEAFGDWRWSDDEWYNERCFVIENGGEEPFEIVVKERKPRWGMLHMAELHRYRDLKDNGILHSRQFGDIILEQENSKALIDYLRSRNSDGYPYSL